MLTYLEAHLLRAYLYLFESLKEWWEGWYTDTQYKLTFETLSEKFKVRDYGNSFNLLRYSSTLLLHWWRAHCHVSLSADRLGFCNHSIPKTMPSDCPRLCLCPDDNNLSPRGATSALDANIEQERHAAKSLKWRKWISK